ncbi:ELWxxDGT repeat protein [Candidatus Riflebacteria bacterium]
MLKERDFLIFLVTILVMGLLSCNFIGTDAKDESIATPKMPSTAALSGTATFPASTGSSASIQGALDLTGFHCFINDTEVSFNSYGTFAGTVNHADQYDIQIRSGSNSKARLRAFVSSASNGIVVDVKSTAHALVYLAFRAQIGRENTTYASFSSFFAPTESLNISLSEKIEQFLQSQTNLETDSEMTDNAQVKSATDAAVTQAKINEASPPSTRTTTSSTSTSTATTSSATKPGATLTINNGASTTSSQTVTLNLSNITGDGALEMSIDGGNWEPIAASKSHTLSAGDGLKTVSLLIRDANGNQSSTITASITLSTSGSSPGSTKFIVTSSSPASGTTGLKLSQANFQLTFSQNIDSSTVSSATAYMISSSTLVSTNLSVSATQLTFTPAYGFVDGDYTITVTTGVKSTSGASMTSNYVSNYSIVGVKLVKDVYAGATQGFGGIDDIMGNYFFFSGRTASYGWELYKSTGGTQGTSLVKNIRSGSSDGYTGSGKAYNGTFYFMGNDGIKGGELWKSDGTSGGTSLVSDIYEGSTGSNVKIPASVGTGSYLYFEATHKSYGKELWKTDGTSAGTRWVSFVAPVGFSYPAVVGSYTIFSATTTASGTELYRNQGSSFITSTTTVLVKDINPGSASSSPAPGGASTFVVMNGYAYFQAKNATQGIELWKSNGISTQTVLVKDINSGGGDSNPGNFCQSGSTLYFTADDGTNGIELWKTNGTTAGTAMVKNINSGGDSSPMELFNATSTLLFSANDGGGNWELWKSDGTSAGTVKIGALCRTPKEFTYLSGDKKIYFNATNASYGAELWRTDLTASGTVLIKDLRPGTSGSDPTGITGFSGNLYFGANDGSSGIELWKLNFY